MLGSVNDDHIKHLGSHAGSGATGGHLGSDSLQSGGSWPPTYDLQMSTFAFYCFPTHTGSHDTPHRTMDIKLFLPQACHDNKFPSTLQNRLIFLVHIFIWFLESTLPKLTNVEDMISETVWLNVTNICRIQLESTGHFKINHKCGN